MSVLELDLLTALTPGARAWVVESADYLAHALARAEPTMVKTIGKLKGRDGLMLRKRFLEATELWQKFMWYRIATHLQGAHGLEEACRLAEQDLLALDALRQPM